MRSSISIKRCGLSALTVVFTVIAAMAVSQPALAADPGDMAFSVARGGKLYDKWFGVLDTDAPKAAHSAYPADGKYAGKGGADWRCKECHGWDYLGKNGAYAKGKHFSGIIGISGMAGADPAKIMAVLKDATHRYRGALDYRPPMDDRNFEDLANFVSKGQVDMNLYIDRDTKKAKGNPREREAFYATICANCHGMDGRKISTRRPLGEVARGNPWEALHNLLNGHPGVEMPPLRVLDDQQTLVDILAYIQTLPGR